MPSSQGPTLPTNAPTGAPYTARRKVLRARVLPSQHERHARARRVATLPLMSSLRAAGSTREWRAVRRYIIERDRDPVTGEVRCWRPDCRVVLTEHDPTLPTHATCGHLVDRVAGGTDQLDKLAAECARCNYAHGARTAHRRRVAAGLNTSRDWLAGF